MLFRSMFLSHRTSLFLLDLLSNSQSRSRMPALPSRCHRSCRRHCKPSDFPESPPAQRLTYYPPKQLVVQRRAAATHMPTLVLIVHPDGR